MLSEARRPALAAMDESRPCKRVGLGWQPWMSDALADAPTWAGGRKGATPSQARRPEPAAKEGAHVNRRRRARRSGTLCADRAAVSCLGRRPKILPFRLSS
ncbi:hypothetical protein FGB62_110g07 [Gracilaria domingensis]|nr:hypothetical protein FGB62_110g07 [Gracilaria domingensis]